uniref:Uncharacterized protein n=1 Tax=Lepeophtheirus salmonis TaxID=72036 RepID=A0A0K2UI38_LEPSM
MYNLTNISQQIYPSFNNMVNIPNLEGTIIYGKESENEIFLPYLKSLDDSSKNYENIHRHVHKKAEQIGNVKGRNFDYIGTAITVAVRILSFLTGTFQRNNLNKNDISQELLNSSLEPLSLENVSTDNHDRVNSNPESFDIAMGTLMAFGGKYLRRTVVWIFDQIQSNPLDKIENNAIGGYLESLNTNELETLATKAVAAGANPIKLQEAFITAQNTGNWNDLELEIASVLGPEAVGGQSVGSGSFIEKIIGHASFLFQPNLKSDQNSFLSNNSLSSDPESGVSGPIYYYQWVQNTVNRLDKIITNEPDPNYPQKTTFLQRFVKEFKLEKEAFTFQKKVNSIIKLVNSYLGDESNKK